MNKLISGGIYELGDRPGNTQYYILVAQNNAIAIVCNVNYFLPTGTNTRDKIIEGISKNMDTIDFETFFDLPIFSFERDDLVYGYLGKVPDELLKEIREKVDNV